MKTLVISVSDLHMLYGRNKSPSASPHFSLIKLYISNDGIITPVMATPKLQQQITHVADSLNKSKVETSKGVTKLLSKLWSDDFFLRVAKDPITI